MNLIPENKGFVSPPTRTFFSDVFKKSYYIIRTRLTKELKETKTDPFIERFPVSRSEERGKREDDQESEVSEEF